MGARVICLQVQEERGAAIKRVQRLYCQAQHGVQNDVHSGPGKRQVCLRFTETSQAMPPDGLCAQKFQENVRIAGMSKHLLLPGAVLQAGGSIMRLTQRGKRCYAGCAAAQRGEICALSRETAFAEVLESGWVAQGDPVHWIGDSDEI